MPIAILLLLLIPYALARRVNVFSAFVKGAADALPLLKTLLPTLAAFTMAMRLFRDSGAEALLGSLLSPALARFGVDARLLPLLIVRPFSGSAATGALLDLFTQYGPDSTVGLTASVLLGSSETVFYTVALYFGAVGVKKTRFAVPVALFALLTAIVFGLLFSSLFFGTG